MSSNSVIYLADTTMDASMAQHSAEQNGFKEALAIGRRGYQLGWISQNPHLPSNSPSEAQARQQWQNGNAVFLPTYFLNKLSTYQNDIAQAQRLSEAVLDGESCDELFSEEPYASRLLPKFELLAASCDESDPQEIETLDFDVIEKDQIVAEALWVKASWLSFVEDDASLRFRFSFGIVGYEDVAADYARQQYAAQLTEAIFPQSAIISEGRQLQSLLSHILGVEHVDYVERIVYFNAPNGGAQFHQDVERGHLGVVFAQMYGRTAWLALSKHQLIEEILHYMASENAESDYLDIVNDKSQWATLSQHCASKEHLNAYLDETDNSPVEYLINKIPRFSRQLIENGYGFILKPGDAILLPQYSVDECCWHSVFCIDPYPGQALSFAIRETIEQ